MSPQLLLPSNFVIHCPEYLAEVVEFADRTGQLKNLQTQFEHLALWRSPFLHIYSDFAPYSVFFMEAEDPEGKKRAGLSGGIIYHGSHDGGGDGGAPTFSVCLEPSNGWSIRT